MTIGPYVRTRQLRADPQQPRRVTCPVRSEQSGDSLQGQMVKNGIWVQTFKISLPPCPPAQANGFLKQQTTAKTKGCSSHGHTAPVESQGEATVGEGWDALSKGPEGGEPLKGRPHSSH